MNRSLALGAAGVAAALSLTACQSSTKGHVSSVASKASAKATSANAQQDKKTAEQLVKPCVPANQASLASPGPGGHAARVTFAQCVGVPKKNRQSFYNCAIKAVEKDHTKAARQDLINVAFPACVKANHG